MQIIISPAKSLDFESPISIENKSNIRFTEEPQLIVEELQKRNISDIGYLMKISDKLAELNYNRYQEWEYPFKPENIRQALFAFKGDVYQGLDAFSLSEEDVTTAQSQLRILSGLYGLLRPLDTIMPYRLEMGTKLSFKKYKNLYNVWGSKITDMLNEDIQTENHKALINLASNEYFKAVKKSDIKVPIITPTFKDLKNGEYKIISFYAKKARGLMTRFIIQNKLTNVDDLKAFDFNGYYYNNNLSTEDAPVFTRDHA